MLNNHHQGDQFRLEKQQITLLGVWQYIDIQLLTQSKTFYKIKTMIFQT